MPMPMRMRRKIAAFRPVNLLDRTKEITEKHGFDFRGFSLFELVNRNDAVKEIEAVFEEDVEIVVFTSVNGVQRSFEICDGKIDLKKKLMNAGVKVCAIGSMTREELEKRGLRVNLMPAKYNYSTAGLKSIFNAIDVKDKRIVLLRSSEGNKELINFLDRKRASVVDIAIYKIKEKDLCELKEHFGMLIEYKPDYLLFTSSLTFKLFLKLSKELNLADEIFRTAKIAAIGDLTADAISEEGIKVDFLAEESTFEGLLNMIK